MDDSPPDTLAYLTRMLRWSLVQAVHLRHPAHEEVLLTFRDPETGEHRLLTLFATRDRGIAAVRPVRCWRDIDLGSEEV